MFSIILFWLGSNYPSGLLFFRACFTSFQLTPLFLPPSYISIPHLIVAVLMRECFEHSCMSSPYPIAILNGTFFFFGLWKQWLIGNGEQLNKFY